MFKFADEAWLEKVVLNPITHRKDKVKSLPPELQEKYRPKTQNQQNQQNPKNKQTTQNKKKFPSAFQDNINMLQKLHRDAHKKVFENQETHMDVKDYHAEMAKHNVVSKIPDGFLGKISKKGVLLTHDGKELDKAIGTNVEPNKNYDPETDDTYYCTSINSHGNPANHYTKDCLKRHGHIKYANNKEFGDKIDLVRYKVANDLNNSKDAHRQLMALLVNLSDQAYFRPGNRRSEPEGVYGLHNLQRRHIHIDKDNNIHFEYLGKDKIPQHQIVKPDDHVRKLIRGFLKDKQPNDYVFTHKGSKVDPDTLNEYFKKTLGAGITIHKLRTYHGSRIMNELLDAVPEGITPDEAMQHFRDASRHVADLLGHTDIDTTLKSYVDHNIPLEYFKKHGVKVPKLISQLAFTRFMLKKANIEILPVVSDKKITPEDIKFINWMDGLVLDNSTIKKSSSIEKISLFLN